MVDDTTQQQAGLVKRLKEQHAAEGGANAEAKCSSSQTHIHCPCLILRLQRRHISKMAVAIAPGSASCSHADPWTAELTVRAFALQAT